jgi:hypothetical protein
VLIGILIALVVILLAAGLFTWIRRAAARQRIIDDPGGEVEYVIYGGVMCRGLTTSGSLVCLDLMDWGVRMRGIPVARWIVPRWEARYDELAIAELVATQYSRNAVWFRLQGDAGGMGFLSERSPEIFRVLERHGVPVNRSVQRVRSAGDLDSPRR